MNLQSRVLMFLSFFILIIPSSFATACPTGYTFTTLTAPSTNQNIYISGYAGFSTSPELIAYFNGLRWNICYKLIGTDSGVCHQRYVFSWTNWMGPYECNYGVWNQYDFKSPNNPPTISSLTWSSLNITGSNSGSISFTINGISDPDASQTVTYLYQWNGTAWTNLSPTNTTPLSNKTYAFSVSGISLSLKFTFQLQHYLIFLKEKENSFNLLKRCIWHQRNSLNSLRQINMRYISWNQNDTLFGI